MGLRAWLTLAVFCFSFLFASSPAVADSLPVGALSFDFLSTDANGNPLYGLDVTDYTAPGGGAPISTFVDFSSLTLNIVLASGGTATEPLTSQDSFGDFSTQPNLFVGGDILSATLTGTFSVTTVLLTDGSTANIDSGFSTALADASGGPLQGGDLAVINATTVAQAVPEPGTLALFGLALMVMVVGGRGGSRLLIQKRKPQLRTARQEASE